MSRWGILLIVGCLAAGIGQGLVEAAKWLHMLSTPSSPWTSALALLRGNTIFPAALMVLGLLAVGWALAWRFQPARPLSTFAAGGIAVLAGILICRAAVFVANPFLFAPPIYLPAFAAAIALAIASALYFVTPPPFRNPRAIVTRSITAGAAWAVHVGLLRIAVGSAGETSFGGFGVFATLVLPPELRAFPSLIQDAVSGSLYGAFAGAAIGLAVDRRRTLCIGAAGAAIGLWAAMVLFASHVLVGTFIVQSAFNEAVAYRSSLLAASVGAVIIAVGLVTALGGVRKKPIRLALQGAVVLPLILSAAYIADARGGAEVYENALRADRYRTRVYIHFHGNGGWTRTVERHGDDIRIAACDRLLRDHPRSMYGADALYMKARSLFMSWRFDDAADTLSELRRRYPDARGASVTLLANCRLVTGDFKAVAGDFGRDEWVYARWRSTEGAQVIGHAYEVLGKTNGARGLYSYYIQNLRETARGAWVDAAVDYAEVRTEAVLQDPGCRPVMSTVAGRVVGQSGPVAGVHIALVQPHIDATSPDDSHQFTSALTIPLWFGLAGTTGKDGSFAIEGVPYGSYEVVVGFDPARLPAYSVIPRPVPPVRVDKPYQTVPNIRFAPGIRPVAPLDGSVTGPWPTLRWKPVPAAAYYSVSVIAEPSRRVSRPAARGAYACWTRSRLTGTSVAVTPPFFTVASSGTDEAAAGALLPDRSYMWIVFAYDKEGRIVSSSEHYRLDRETLFHVRSGISKGG